MKFISKFIRSFLILKGLFLTLAWLNSERSPEYFESSNLSSIYEKWNKMPLEKNHAIKMFENQEMTILKLPKIRKTPKAFFAVVIVLSSSKNFARRMKIRTSMKFYPDISVVFLLGSNSDRDSELLLLVEDNIYKDILQGSLKDSYHNLAYKSILGFLWVYRTYNSAKFVIKIDDDVTLDWNYLIKALNIKYPDTHLFPKNAILCPSPMKNMRPWRPKALNNLGIVTVMSKWSVKYEEMSRRVFPDFCPGWVYVSTPDLMMKVSSVAGSLCNATKMKRLDDIFITGFSRERIPGVEVEELDSSVWTQLWKAGLMEVLVMFDLALSKCPFLGITKNIFFNKFVKEKGCYIKNWWFYWCAFYEYFILDNVEYLVPGVLTHDLVRVCERDA